jgi:copper chaperone CopZ
MKSILILMTAVMSLSVSAQVSRVTIQASGMTCSMCSNSINKSLKTIDFVETVTPNLETSSFEITFKSGASVDFDKLKIKVEDAGFFVAGFTAEVNFDKTQVKPKQQVKVAGKNFIIMNTTEQIIEGLRPVKVINKGFVSDKEYKKYGLAKSAAGNGNYNVIIL